MEDQRLLMSVTRRSLNHAFCCVCVCGVCACGGPGKINARYPLGQLPVEGWVGGSRKKTQNVELVTAFNFA